MQSLLVRLRVLLRRDEAEAGIDEERARHVERGMTTDEARAAAPVNMIALRAD